MKIKELLELLKTADKECNIYVSADSEGNSWSSLDAKFSFYYDFNEDTGEKFYVLIPYVEGLDYFDLK